MTIKSCERNDNSTAKLVIEIDKETFEQNIEKAYRQARGKIFVPGFRKGKAPRKVVEGMYGASVFYEDAINLLFPEAFKEAVESEKLDAIGNPSVTAVDTTDGVLTLTVETDVYPTVTLGQYKGLEVPKAEATLTDAEVDAEIERLRERNARITTVERPAQLGDTVVIDFEGFKDGVPFEGGKGEGHSLKLGSGSFIPGFEDQLVGCSAGEEKTVEVVFPENYGASELAGQPATFQCKVHEVKETVKPALDDEFAKDCLLYTSRKSRRSCNPAALIVTAFAPGSLCRGPGACGICEKTARAGKYFRLMNLCVGIHFHFIAISCIINIRYASV